MRKYLLLSLQMIWGLFLCGSIISQIPESREHSDMPSKRWYILSLEKILVTSSYLYAMSHQDGLIIFRVHSDSLYWIDSFKELRDKGTLFFADVRFTYLMGQKHLFIIDPTLKGGLYQTIELPYKPKSIFRFERQLFIFFPKQGIYSFDMDNTKAGLEKIKDYYLDKHHKIRSMVGNGRMLYILIDSRRLVQFRVEKEQLQLIQERPIDHNLLDMYFTNNLLIGIDDNNTLWNLSLLDKVSYGSLPSKPFFLSHIGSYWITELFPNKWYMSLNLSMINKDNNYIGDGAGLTSEVLFYNIGDWLYSRQINSFSLEDNRLLSLPHKKIWVDGESILKKIPSQTIVSGRDMLIPIEIIQRQIPLDEIVLRYDSSTIKNMILKGYSLYWKPIPNDIGTHWVTVYAHIGEYTDEMKFSIEVKAVDKPPKFVPFQPKELLVGKFVSIQIKAFDPDGVDSTLVRYLGVNLPDGGVLEENTGIFRWEPRKKHVGINYFTVIALDQYGQATNQEFTLKVIEN